MAKLLKKIYGSSNFSTKPANSPMEKVDCVVIGAGIVGIAVARALALKGRREVLVVHSAPTFGASTSSRNSQVIHAGIYYPRNSLKAALCVHGRRLLYDYCSERGIPHKRIGKLVVANGESGVSKLSDLMNRGETSWVVDSGATIHVTSRREFFSSYSPGNYGVVRMGNGNLSKVVGKGDVCLETMDGARLLLQDVRHGDAENHGTTFSYNSTVIGGNVEGDSFNLRVIGRKELENWDGNSNLDPEFVLVPKLVVNSAGLSAVPLARRFDGLSGKVIPPAHFARGLYFTLSNTKEPPFQHLIYPTPEDGGLGVHVTLDLDGQVKFGPNVEWIRAIDDASSFLDKYDYSVDASQAERFYPEIRKYYPNLKDGSLEPGYSGIRPKVTGPGESAGDFVIQGEDIHGVPGLVNLFGIESPGLTSSMAIAEYVANRYSK
ncbi:L-2-hydroxyglutarate dehydrogenase, mitochondrial [Linum grandiflorum]